MIIFNRGNIKSIIILFAILLVHNSAHGLTTGEKFHSDTRHTWLEAIKGVFTKKTVAPPFKEYKGVKMKLPKPEYRGLVLEDAIIKRRSNREYAKKPLFISELSQLLFAAQGVTGRIYGTPLRTTPSAGALYPYEIYIVVNNVENLAKGVYHYSLIDHAIVLIKEGDFSRDIMKAALDQEMTRDAGVVFILAAIFDRTRAKYGERGYRYVYMEAGHISQNIYLQAASLGLGTVMVGAFLDDDMNKLIMADGKKEAVIAIQAVGKI